MKNRLIAILAVVVLYGCAHGASKAPASEPFSEEDVISALISNDQPFVDQYTSYFLSHTVAVTKTALNDMRYAPATVLVDGPRHERMQYGVATVSDYFLCLLHVKQATTTRDVIGRDLGEECPHEDDCEPCNSLARPMPEDVKRELVKAWAAREVSSASELESEPNE